MNTYKFTLKELQKAVKDTFNISNYEARILSQTLEAKLKVVQRERLSEEDTNKTKNYMNLIDEDMYNNFLEWLKEN